MIEQVVTVVVVGGVAIVGLKYLGVWDKLLGTGKEKANQLVDNATTGVEKKRMQVRDLGVILNSMAEQMTDLDGKFGRAQSDVLRADQALETAVQNLQDVQAVIPDPNAMTADQRNTLNSKAQAVQAAEADKAAKQKRVTELGRQCERLHEDYGARKSEFDAAAAAIPEAETKQILTNANNIASSFGKKQEAFKQAAQMGSDADGQIDEALAKSAAEAQLHGGSTDTERAAAARKQDQATADILSKYGKK